MVSSSYGEFFLADGNCDGTCSRPAADIRNCSQLTEWNWLPPGYENPGNQGDRAVPLGGSEVFMADDIEILQVRGEIAEPRSTPTPPQPTTSPPPTADNNNPRADTDIGADENIHFRARADTNTQRDNPPNLYGNTANVNTTRSD